jgi:hypothetical protein
VAEGQDLGILSRLAAAQQVQPVKDPDDGEIQKSDRHSPRSCVIAVSAKPQVTAFASSSGAVQGR